MMAGWRPFLTAWALIGWAPLVLGQQSPMPATLGIKYMRDSQEYATLARQVYRVAADAVARRVQAIGRRPWVVILDVDETALDNSVYELERAAYGLPFASASFLTWALGHQSGAVPGASDFVAGVRRAGGHIAWITNRDAAAKEATRINLGAVGLWNDDDRLCPQDTPERVKRVRRAEVVSGRGDCAWSGTPMRAVAFVGDQMGDFPAADEGILDTGSDDAFGRTCFLLPNSMYGEWTARVTRVR